MIGRTLGHYEIAALLGKGGMGEVYRARDTKLGREVAVKVLPTGLGTDPERLQRFQREAKTLAVLDHPGIVSVYSVEEVDDIHFLTMQLIEGQPLDTLIPEGGLPLDRIFDIGSRLAEALAAAHQAHIIHRDLKPANVMVTNDHRVKVLDFGLATVEPRACGPDDSTVTQLTADGVVMGTAPYMSPEQISAQPVDARTDIYAIGVVLYQMTTGRQPFTGGSIAELASAILRDAPTPLGDMRPEAPAALGRLVAHCLEKEATKRTKAAHDIAAELATLRSSSSSSQTQSDTTRTSPVQPMQASTSIAVLPFNDMSADQDQAYLCEGMAEEVMHALVQIEGIRVASRTSSFRARESDLDLAALGQALSVSHVLEGSVRTAGSRLRVTAQLIDVARDEQVWSDRLDREVIDVFAVQDDIAAGVVDAIRTHLAPGEQAVQPRDRVKNLEAYRHFLQARYLRYTKNDPGGALREFQQATTLDPTHAPAWVGLAEVNVLAAFYAVLPSQSALATATEALSTANRLAGPSADRFVVECMVAFAQHDWDASIAAGRRAIELQPDHVQGLSWLALALAVRHQGEEARDLVRRAREADPLSPYPYAMTAGCLLVERRFEESIAFCDQALGFSEDNTLALWLGGTAQVAQGNTAAGIDLLQRACKPTLHGTVLHAALGWAYAMAGQNEAARDVERHFKERPATAPTVVTYAWLLAALGQTDPALDVLEAAAAEHQPFFGLASYPGLDGIRGEARFAALMERVGLS